MSTCPRCGNGPRVEWRAFSGPGEWWRVECRPCGWSAWSRSRELAMQGWERLCESDASKKSTWGFRMVVDIKSERG